MSESQISHSAVGAGSALATKLSTRTRHVMLFLGAGASCAAGLPNLQGLGLAVAERLETADKDLFNGLMDGRNIEQALSRLRRIAGLLGDGDEYASLTKERAHALDQRVGHAIIDVISTADLDARAFVELASWAGGEYYSRPLEIFTVNYDTLIEQGLETARVPYFDGFVGNLRATFRPELIDPRVDGSPSGMPPSFVRLWKLHGSVNWVIEPGSDIGAVLRVGMAASGEQVAAIYPSDEKYDASRRVPFVVLQDHLRRSLLEPETMLLVSGYSFGDQHLNELVFDAAQQRPRSDFTVCCFDSIPDVLAERATRLRNITVLAPKEAIISGVRALWTQGEEGAPVQVWQDERFLLGDFAALTRFLVSATHGLQPEQSGD